MQCHTIKIVQKLDNYNRFKNDRTDRQTDGRTTCDRNTALCTIVHCAVKTQQNARIYDVIYACVWHTHTITALAVIQANYRLG